MLVSGVCGKEFYREATADWVTKYVRDIEANVLLMNDFPSQLVQIAQADACGTCYERG